MNRHLPLSDDLVRGAAVAALTMVLAACGGGGSSSPAPASAPAPAPAPTPTPVPSTVNVQASVAPQSINQGRVTGGGSVASGQSVTLTATPNSGFVFARWTENGRDVSTSTEYTFTAGANKQLVAHFMHDVNGIWFGTVTDNEDSSTHDVLALLHNGTLFMGSGTVGIDYIYAGTYSTSGSGSTRAIQVSSPRLYQAGASQTMQEFTGTLGTGKSTLSSSNFKTFLGNTGTLSLAYTNTGYAAASSLAPLAKTWHVDGTTWGGVVNETPPIETGIIQADGSFTATDEDSDSPCSITGRLSLLNPGANFYGVTASLSEACRPRNAQQYGDYKGLAYRFTDPDSGVDILGVVAHNGDYALEVGLYDRPRVSNPMAGFTADVFEPSADFRNRCAAPRNDTVINGRTYRWPDVQGTPADEKYWIRSYIHEEYLWYREVEDLDPAGISDRLDYFDRLTINKDRFSDYESTEDSIRSASGRVYGYGMRVVWRRLDDGTLDFYVAYIESDSPAAEEKIDRGDRILKVSTVGPNAETYNVSAPTSRSELEKGWAAIYNPANGSTYSFSIRKRGASEPTDIEVTAGEVTVHPVHNVKRVLVDGEYVGYMTFNTFLSRLAEGELKAAINELNEGDGIEDLVLDLRYNGGGYVYVARQLSYMIAGDWSRDLLFLEYLYNDKRLEGDYRRNFLSVGVGHSLPEGEKLPTLNLGRGPTDDGDASNPKPGERDDAGTVYVLTSARTCSASEVVINGLRGVNVNVVLIGSTTCGKTYGFVPADNCGIRYSAANFQSINAKGFGDYADGFKPENVSGTGESGSILGNVFGTGVSVPGCHVAWDDTSKDLGDITEARFAAALKYRKDGSCPTVTTAAAPPLAAAYADGTTIEPPDDDGSFVGAVILEEDSVRGVRGIQEQQE